MAAKYDFHGQNAYADGLNEERAKWLPLYEAIKEFDSYFDFNTPLDDSNGLDDVSGVNEAMLKVRDAIQNLRSQGEK
jgi:hypothetical protein